MTRKEGYGEKSFLYEDCIGEMNRKLNPSSGMLPRIDRKNQTLEEINEIIRGYSLPVLYRYMPLTMNAFSISTINLIAQYSGVYIIT